MFFRARNAPNPFLAGVRYDAGELTTLPTTLPRSRSQVGGRALFRSAWRLQCLDLGAFGALLPHTARPSIVFSAFCVSLEMFHLSCVILATLVIHHPVILLFQPPPLFFFSNLTLHAHPALRGLLYGFFLRFSFFSSFRYRYFLPFLVFLSQASYLSRNRRFVDFCLFFFLYYFSSIWNIFSFFSSFCGRLNWQLACQFSSANHQSYRIVIADVDGRFLQQLQTETAQVAVDHVDVSCTSEVMHSRSQWRRQTGWVGCVHTPCQENT